MRNVQKPCFSPSFSNIFLSSIRPGSVDSEMQGLDVTYKLSCLYHLHDEVTTVISRMQEQEEDIKRKLCWLRLTWYSDTIKTLTVFIWICQSQSVQTMWIVMNNRNISFVYCPELKSLITLFSLKFSTNYVYTYCNAVNIWRNYTIAWFHE